MNTLTNTPSSAPTNTPTRAPTENHIASHLQEPTIRTNLSTHRLDYLAPNYWVDTVHMGFDLHPTQTKIATRSTIRHREGAPHTLVWQGDCSVGGVILEFVAINGKRLEPNDYELTIDAQTGNSTLMIENLPDQATVDIATALNPSTNTALMGLYASQGNLFTQCEAQGFRRLSYFADRPDVMARYTVMLRADKTQYPVLLSNGNLLDSGDLLETNGQHEGRHYALWQDPHLKPSYLFAVVAGNLVANQAWIKNPSIAKKKSLLQIFTRPQDSAATQWAMDSLKASIAWDLKTFGRPLDLERYMIVAVGDFNMGAMENKGLNVFNTAYVLAQHDTATDSDFSSIEAVVGHEYFHNWTGNRVTCKDWFQLTLKEGLTVYRDQQFSADMAAGFGQRTPKLDTKSAKAVRRIDDVAHLRAAQFGEDMGPMAHPIRPESYEDISNFYTATVYDKGAEIIRMLALLANEARSHGFRKAMDTYFARHDGQAVSCEEFVAAVADASGADLTQFKHWYTQAGTPRVDAQAHYDPNAKTYALTLTQSNAPVGIEPKTKIKPPLHIPICVGLLGSSGVSLKSKLLGKSQIEHVLHLKTVSHTFVFEGLASEPTPSLLRGFSAPIKLNFAYSDAQLSLMIGHDTDAFNRWEAAQRLYERLMVANYHGTAQSTHTQSTHTLSITTLANALATALNDPSLDNAFKASLLMAPSYNLLADALADNLRPQALFSARESILNALAHELRDLWPNIYTHMQSTQPYRPDAKQTGQRSLKNAALSMWLRVGNKHSSKDNAGNKPTAGSARNVSAVSAAKRQYANASNMTDRLAALTGLLHHHPNDSQQALADFYQRFAGNDLVVDKWFALQASNPNMTAAQVKRLLSHPEFTWQTPNRMRAVVFRFCMGNPVAFHNPQGYKFWLACVKKLVRVNPEVAARLARAMEQWTRHHPPLAQAMKATIAQALTIERLPKAVVEVLSKSIDQ